MQQKRMRANTKRLSVYVPAHVAVAMEKLAIQRDQTALHYVSLGQVWAEGALLLLKRERIHPELPAKIQPGKAGRRKRQPLAGAA